MESCKITRAEYKLSINLVEQMDIFKIINEIVQNKFEINDDDAFFLLNIDDLVMKYNVWVSKMPRVKPHYAVKCNDSEIVLKTLAELGTGFDCASKGELEMILKIGVESDRIIYANPTKQTSHLRFAKEMKVEKMTCDSVMELYKIKSIYPEAKVVLRIRFDAKDALLSLGAKFGCDPVSEAPQLIELCKTLELDLIGFSFHVGSGCKDFEIYEKALYVIRELFNFASTIGIVILDIGGGFPGENFEKINEFSGLINNVLDEEFPAKKFPDLEIYSEPGRYFVESAFTLVSKIHSRKITKDEDGNIIDVMYYLNEGVYSNFLFVPLGPEVVVPKLLPAKQSDIKFKSTLWGPTCDSTDIICADIQLEKLEINDCIYFQLMGAYTIPLRTPFNGFEQTKVRYHINRDD
ncbi:unnamed protein product [Diamesa serratosioi]